MTEKKDLTVIEKHLPAGVTLMEMIDTLRNSLYPGAKDESIKLVLSYCHVAGLDVMEKPVHIVPMDVQVRDADGSVSWIKRDVVMPGIGLYRTKASRTGEYAGVTEPEFGPIKKIKTKVKQYNNAHRGDKSYTMVDGEELEFPEWCKVTVKKRNRLGQVDEYTAKEFWLENYATAGKDTTAPNAMWKKRPYGQLSKCAEAQALRKAFPELGAAPTADETIIESDDIIIEHEPIPQPKSKKPAAAQEVAQAATQGTKDPDTAPAAAPNTDAGQRQMPDESNERPSGVSSPSPDTASVTESSAAQKPGGVSTGTTDKGGSPSSAADAGTDKPMLAAQMRIINAKCVNAGITIDDLVKQLGVPVDQWRFDDFGPITKLIAEKTQ